MSRKEIAYVYEQETVSWRWFVSKLITELLSCVRDFTGKRTCQMVPHSLIKIEQKSLFQISFIKIPEHPKVVWKSCKNTHANVICGASCFCLNWSIKTQKFSRKEKKKTTQYNRAEFIEPEIGLDWGWWIAVSSCTFPYFISDICLCYISIAQIIYKV